MRLTIAVPTYNRAKRLRKALLELSSEINSAINKSDVSVFVSNNGSTDDTADIIAGCGKYFQANRIPFTSRTADSNQGFDANVLACYAGSDAEYVWFLSDDDNIIPGAVDAIINDIKAHYPSVLYYNHDQKPYDKTRPYIKKLELFNQIATGNAIGLKKITNWPKLSSLVIKKCEAGMQVPNLNSGFSHIALALNCGLTEGMVLHSPVFTAHPDEDYNDNIDFPPYIGNNLNLIIQWILNYNKKMCLYDELALGVTDPLISTLNTLGAYYRGRHTLTLPLKSELWGTVQREIKFGWRKRLMDWKSVKELVKFPVSIAYGLGHAAITGKKLTKDRPLF